MAELWLVVSLILGVVFGLLVLLASGNVKEDDAIKELLEDWDIQDHLEEIAEEEELLLEEEQDAQELIDLLYLENDENEEYENL